MTTLRLLKKYFFSRQPASGPVKQHDFEMYLEPVDLGNYRQQLASYGFTLTTVQTVTYQDKPYESFQIDVPSPSAGKRLLLFAGVHGNEFAAVLAVPDLLQDIQANPGIYAGWHIRIITPVNPVGLAHQSRYNENGHDINRDFKHFATKGAKLQKTAVEQFKPDIMVSMHEGPQDGFFVIGDGPLPAGLPEHIVSNLQQAAIKLADKSFFGLKIGRGFWRKRAAAYALQKAVGNYSFGRYARQLGVPLLTTESPWDSHNVHARKRAHVVVVRSVVAWL